MKKMTVVTAIVASLLAGTATPGSAHVGSSGATGAHDTPEMLCDNNYYDKKVHFSNPNVYANARYAEQLVALRFTVFQYYEGSWYPVDRTGWSYYWVTPTSTTTRPASIWTYDGRPGATYAVGLEIYWRNPTTDAWDASDLSFARTLSTGSRIC
ncbi:MAG: hypothetical protein R3320_05235 [Nitriliruptorales bacterium]|nr:hypothetical protein [Nitriliruptorales bacterium]